MLDSGLVNQGSLLNPTRSPDRSRIILDRPAPPREKWVLTPESFNELLLWLNQDREQAGVKYEEIRSQLINRFRHLGCREPEELANETFDRVARKLPDIVGTYRGEPEPYFFSVAHYIYKEHGRKPVLASLTGADFRQPSRQNQQEEFEKELLDSCLRHCMEKLNQANRELIRNYYYGERQDKISSRKELAERLGVKLPNLRLKAQRVRTTLKKCLLECVQSKSLEREVFM